MRYTNLLLTLTLTIDDYETETETNDEREFRESKTMIFKSH